MNIRKLNHVSPSSLSQYENQPNTFFMEKLHVPSWPRSPQGVPAKIGTMFDSFIKISLAKALKQMEELKQKVGYTTAKEAGETKNLFDYIVHKQIDDYETMPDADRNKILTRGYDIYQYYERLMLNSDILCGYSWDTIELSKQVILNGNIPTYCKGDASLFDSDRRLALPFDWKVTGAGAEKSATSPPKLYESIFNEAGECKGPHKNWTRNIQMQDIDSKWATQLVFSGWQLGAPIVPEKMFPYKGVIHCLVCNATKPENFRVRLAVYRGELSVEWQRSVLQRAINMWESIADGSFIHDKRFVDLTSMLASSETWY